MPALPYENPPFFKRGPSPFARFIFFSLASLVLLFADGRYGYLENVRIGLYIVIAPLQRVALFPGEIADAVATYFAAQSKLTADNKQLRQQLVAQGAIVQSARSVVQENERLRGLLNARTRYAGNDILAEVLYLGRDPFSQKLYLNRGSAHQVKSGQAVIDDAGVVGQITRVFPNVSEVTLLTEKDHTIPVKVERNGVRTLLVGAGTGHAPELRFMAANADIQSGDVLVTSGLDGTYPAGLAVAVVAAVERDSGLMFARITCRPLAGVDRSDQVLIVSIGAVRDRSPSPRWMDPGDRSVPESVGRVARSAAGQADGGGAVQPGVLAHGGVAERTGACGYPARPAERVRPGEGRDADARCAADVRPHRRARVVCVRAAVHGASARQRAGHHAPGLFRALRVARVRRVAPAGCRSDARGGRRRCRSCRALARPHHRRLRRRVQPLAAAAGGRRGRLPRADGDQVTEEPC